MTTIELDSGTLSHIKLYCISHNIPQKDFIRFVLNRDKDFKEFEKKIVKIE